MACDQLVVPIGVTHISLPLQEIQSREQEKKNKWTKCLSNSLLAFPYLFRSHWDLKSKTLCLVSDHLHSVILTRIGNGWLVPFPEDKLGPLKGLIPLMAALQQNKKKVRPVIDYWELNHHVDTFTANAVVCAAKLHDWWQKGANVSLLDLGRAYL